MAKKFKRKKEISNEAHGLIAELTKDAVTTKVISIYLNNCIKHPALKDYDLSPPRSAYWNPASVRAAQKRIRKGWVPTTSVLKTLESTVDLFIQRDADMKKKEEDFAKKVRKELKVKQPDILSEIQRPSKIELYDQVMDLLALDSVPKEERMDYVFTRLVNSGYLGKPVDYDFTND